MFSPASQLLIYFCFLQGGEPFLPCPLKWRRDFDDVFTGWSCISYFCGVELFSNPLLLGGSRFAMFSQVEEDFDDVFTVGAVLIFLPRRGLLCYQDIFCLRGICNHIFCQVWGAHCSPFLVATAAAVAAASPATASPAAAVAGLEPQ